MVETLKLRFRIVIHLLTYLTKIPIWKMTKKNKRNAYQTLIIPIPTIAKKIVENFNEEIKNFVKVLPLDFKEALKN